MTDEQKLNEAIKEICKLAGIKQATDITELKGGESVKITKPKYEMITSKNGLLFLSASAIS